MLQYLHKFATVRTYVAYTFISFLFLFLSHLSVTLKPQPLLLFHTDVSANDHFHADLSVAMVFLFLVVVWWVGLDGDVWIQIVLAGFGSDEGGWVQIG